MSTPKPMDPERLAMLRRLHADRFVLAGDMIDELLADRDCLAAELAAINVMGADLAKTLGEDDPHHPLDVLAASVMHQLREARTEVARLRARDMNDAPNLLDAVLGADAEGIVEMLDEIARRIGARGNSITITFSAPEHHGDRHPSICLRGYKVPHPVADNMPELIGLATLRKRKATKPAALADGETPT
jgi:hypothetical protein